MRGLRIVVFAKGGKYREVNVISLGGVSFHFKSFFCVLLADATLEIEIELVELKKKNILDHYMDFIQNIHMYAFFILGLTFLLSGYYKSKIAEKRRLYREIEELEKKKEKDD